MKQKIFSLIIILIIIFNVFPYSCLASIDVGADSSSISEVVNNEPEIVSEAGFLMEVNSGNVLYSKNSKEKLYPASTTKIMTCILAIENCELSEIATVSQNAVDLVPSGYSNAKLVPGEEMPIKDLLYALMLNSANEAANVLAEHVSGTIDEFANLMNQKAAEIGCENTHFVNTNGMHNINHYTTAEDLAKIAVYCMKNEVFREIVSTLEYDLPVTNLYKETRTMKNTNLLINPESKYYLKNVIGVKTGYTKEAGNCLISYAITDDGEELVCVTLKAGNSSETSVQRFIDNKEVLEYGLDNFSTREIIKQNKLIDTVQVKNATNKTKYLDIITKDSVSDFISNDIDLSNIKYKVELEDEISAPIKSGEKLGLITYEINGKEYETELVAKTDVERSYVFVIYIVATVVILVIVSIIINLKLKNNREDEF